MKKYYLIVLISFITLFVACSTVKNKQDSVKVVEQDTTKEIVKPKPIPKLKEYRYISLTASIEFVNSGAVNEFNATINQNNDTLGMKVLGPFNISVAELFSTTEKFFLLDKWNAVLYKGKPTKENFKKSLQIPISYKEIIGLIRCNPYGDISRFANGIQSDEDIETYTYADETTKDSLWFSKKHKTVARYKHKSTKQDESYFVAYSYGESNDYPNKIVFVSGKNKLTLNIEKFSLEKFTVKSIKIPDNAKVVDLDETK